MKQLTNKILSFRKILLFLFLLLLPTQLGTFFFFEFSYIKGVKIDYLAPSIYLTDVLVIFTALFYRKTLARFFIKHWQKIFLLTSLFALNIILSAYPSLALFRFFKFIELVVVFIVLFKHKLSTKHTIMAFLIGALVESGLSVGQLYYKSSLQGLFYFLGERQFNLSHPGIAKTSLFGAELLRPYGTFSHPNSLAGFYLLLYMLFLTHKKIQKHVLLRSVSLVLFALLVFFSFSKIAIITFFILNAIYAFMKFKKEKCTLCTISKILGTLSLSFLFLQAVSDPLSLTKRMTLISNTASILRENLIFGVGLGHYLYSQAQFTTPYSYFFLQPVHNIFLLALSQMGLLLFAPLVYYLLRYIKKRINNMAFVFCLAVVIVTGSFDHYWITLQQNWLLLAVCFALI